MAKKYFCTFGYAENNKESLINELSALLGVEFHPASGGRFVCYLEGIANRISIFNNYLEEDDWWQESEFKEFPILIKISVVDSNLSTEFHEIKNKLENVNFLSKLRGVEIDRF